MTDIRTVDQVLARMLTGYTATLNDAVMPLDVPAAIEGAHATLHPEGRWASAVTQGDATEPDVATSAAGTCWLDYVNLVGLLSVADDLISNLAALKIGMQPYDRRLRSSAGRGPGKTGEERCVLGADSKTNCFSERAGLQLNIWGDTTRRDIVEEGSTGCVTHTVEVARRADRLLPQRCPIRWRAVFGVAVVPFAVVGRYPGQGKKGTEQTRGQRPDRQGRCFTGATS
ncbi:hypothetical protein [Streptomyces achromogenes]|uniref:hypothetical protein n=1 Tax=Streptomyces achromogenes TaxID=67255 RepID=UPI003A80BA04